MHRIKLNPRIRHLMDDSNIHPNLGWDSIKAIAFDNTLQVSVWSRHSKPGPNVVALSSLGYMSYTNSPAVRIKTGAYCSIAPGSAVMGDAHPIDRVTTHPLTYGKFYQEAARKLGAVSMNMVSPFQGRPAPVILGDDVWIGGNVTFAGGVRIGTGAVVAARSVVTKDIPPYAIAGGVPARILRYRFPDDVITALQETRWWDYQLNDIAQFDFNDPMTFCATFMEKRDSIAPRRDTYVTAAELLALA